VTGSGHQHDFLPVFPASIAHKQLPVYYTIRQVALLAQRSPKTIANLCSAYAVPRKTGWVVRRRHRQKVVLLNPDVAAWLVRITLCGERPCPGGWTHGQDR
jgi:hypothetical protein